MSKSIPTTLTIEEAVALMIGLDYIPCGLTVLDMTAAFLEESQIEHESNTRSESFSLRHSACLARHQLAQSLLSALSHEASNPDTEYLVRSNDVSPTIRFSTESLNHWAQDQFGITLWAPSKPSEQSEKLVGLTWRDVTIKIYADYQIGYQIGHDRIRRSSFDKLGLIGKRKLTPNEVGGMLIALSQRGVADMSKKTAISKLRTALRKIINFPGDPFPLINEVDGWKPAFNLIDDRRNADERAETEATHESYEENIHSFRDEGSLGDDWLRENDN